MTEIGPDWGDVVRRARRRRAHRWTLQAMVVAVLAVGVASAYALGHPVIDFGTAAPAGHKQVDEFGSMQVAAPRGMAPGVRPGKARRITSVRFDGKAHTLYVAPTRSGGYCYVWTGLGGGCRPRRGGRGADAVYTGGMVGPSGLQVLETTFLQAKGERLVMGFRDGATVEVPFVWVSAPIDAGFAVYRVPDAHRRTATRPVWLALYDANGKLLGRDPIQGPEPPTVSVRVRGFGALTIPYGGIWAKARQLFDLRAPNGQRVGLWVMPKRGGGTCFVTNTAGGCGTGTKPPFEINLGFNGARLCCGVARRIVRVEARFQDGARISLYPKEGYLVWPIPADHYALGHRLVALVGYDAAGRAVAHGRVPRPVDQRGIYPCRRPKSLGYGVKMCS